VFTDAG